MNKFQVIRIISLVFFGVAELIIFFVLPPYFLIRATIPIAIVVVVVFIYCSRRLYTVSKETSNFGSKLYVAGGVDSRIMSDLAAGHAKIGPRKGVFRVE